MPSRCGLRIHTHLDLFLNSTANFFRSLPDDHPVRIAARTYSLSLSLTLGPAVFSALASSKSLSDGVRALRRALKRELSPSGFAFAMTVAVSGIPALQEILKRANESYQDLNRPDSAHDHRVSGGISNAKSPSVSPLNASQTFLSNAVFSCISLLLLRGRGRNSRKGEFALDLSLILFVRALDSLVQRFLRDRLERGYAQEGSRVSDSSKQRLLALRTNVDALIFWASSARIMWCFFYEPERLPKTYNKWIMTLANIDPRILGALRAIRSGAWTYRGRVSTIPDLVSSLSTDLGYPSAWGDASLIPAYGGSQANGTWKTLGVRGRNGVGGIPCELVHGGIGGSSCAANATLRGSRAFLEALMLYLPVHFLPVILSRPHIFLNPSRLAKLLASVCRSAAFLSTFVSSIWIAVCLTRTLLLARLFPFVSHDFWDGPLGCTFAGSLVCGASIWIEEGRRRGEIALYVLPRAIRACLPEGWLRKRGTGMRLAETLTYVLSLSTLLTMAMHRPDSLRGLSRAALAFVLHGTKAGSSKRKPSEGPPMSGGPQDAPHPDQNAAKID
ncbi:hypothetical protein OBBRIDRAFT_766267 [Obba rivulosa]|uniref:Transmembrane protein 135 N-terminal domain-containing protein n=1 Tax=Obba rivulosa TaxID=1052685 RepID=A0A8E2DUM7_9APHY|nr:hypothetical protein OBBRIDRAFT_766267 [Obba rivulosa]